MRVRVHAARIVEVEDVSCWGLAVRLCCPAATQHLWMLLWAQARTSAAAPALGLSACLPTQQTLAAGARTLLGMSAFQFLGYSNVYFGGSLAVPPYPPARACVHACECARACARECACVRVCKRCACTHPCKHAHARPSKHLHTHMRCWHRPCSPRMHGQWVQSCSHRANVTTHRSWWAAWRSP